MRYDITSRTPLAWTETPIAETPIVETRVDRASDAMAIAPLETPAAVADRKGQSSQPASRTRRWGAPKAAARAADPARGLRPLGLDAMRTLMAIELARAEICVRRENGTDRAGTLAADGSILEAFDRDAVRELIAEGRLSLRRFNAGGAIYGLARPPEARAAYWSAGRG